ncbi:hypothetical protein HMPREF1547_01109 [Blautia sp. KLE 1732]|jgi:hypothetical protein|nr:hypothetical protein HMPREF1547_01109 [Blautia sp. KLE 1732]
MESPLWFYWLHYIIREKFSQVWGKDWRKYSRYSEDFPCIFPDGFNIMVSSIRKAEQNIQSG